MDNGNPLQYSCLENPMDSVLGSTAQVPLSSVLGKPGPWQSLGWPEHLHLAGHVSWGLCLPLAHCNPEGWNVPAQISLTPRSHSRRTWRFPAPLQLSLFSPPDGDRTQSCPTLSDPMDCSPPGSPIPRILQARTLEWVAMPFSRALSRRGSRPSWRTSG